jgi:type I restriction enzyme R subunit
MGSNFAFLQAVGWRETYADCARAESYALSDPRAACIYARRAAEQVVDYLYDVLQLPVPFANELSARINDAGFKAETGIGIVAKLNVIRRLGNSAAHDQQPIAPQQALDALKELHHVMLWAAFHHSTNPSAAPMNSKFDPALAKKAAPLTRAEVAQLAQKFAEQDAAHAKALAAKDEDSAAKDARIAELVAQIAAVQAGNNLVDNRDYGEAKTRDNVIDPLLAEAGWPLADARDREYPVTGMPPDGGAGYVDYVLWGRDEMPLAVVEAKRTSRSPQEGQHQAKLYADCLEKKFGRRPVIFYTNGVEHWLWDDAAGYPPREVAGFYTRGELELLTHRRHARKPLAEAVIDSGIVERHYQHHAIRAVDEVFEDKRRRALLVMATGAGKTRTVIALVKQLMEAGWVKRVLFLADRTALVKQAAGAFTEHLPSVTTVNLLKEKNPDGRVFVSTYPTIMNLINDMSSGRALFGPGSFDLVVIDEAHRSVYQKYRAIFSWFDSLLVGLTATPKDEVDHNTYRLFHLQDGLPTDAYSLDDAVKEKFLVPAVGVAVGTKFIRQGIRYADLSEEEKDEWDALEWGEDGPPDEVSSDELNRFLFNEDTVDQVLATLTDRGHKVCDGDRLGKTIVFAKNQRHAEFIQQRFDIQYPEYAGHFARVITHGTSHVDSLIDDFKTPDKAPHIAISVDMLDTGIDVPEVLNLVFFKQVRSNTKFWQMIGRGTRTCNDLFGPGRDKENFYVFDFCGNLEFFGAGGMSSSQGSTQKSLNQWLFETRLGVLVELDVQHTGESSEAPEGSGDQTEHGLRWDTARQLHTTVAGMNLDNFLVRPHRRLVERYSEWSGWSKVTVENAAEIAGSLAGLPSGNIDHNENAKRFDLLILRRQLAQLQGDTAAMERIREHVQAIAAGLVGKEIPVVRAQHRLLEEVASDEWWVDVTLPMLEVARRRLRGLLQFLVKELRNPIYTSFQDELSDSRIVVLPAFTPGTDMERFRAKAAAYLKAHQDHVALQRLRRNKALTPDDLAALEKMLLDSGVADPQSIVKAAEEKHGLGLFIRSLVGLDRQAAMEAFSTFLDGKQFTANQIHFVNLIIDDLIANGVVEPGRLYESPYTDLTIRGPQAMFTEDQIATIVNILDTVRDNALPSDGAASA